MKIFDKRVVDTSDKTPILIPLITVDFHKQLNSKIKIGDSWRNIEQYLFTGEFYDQKEYDDFLKEMRQQFNELPKT